MLILDPLLSVAEAEHMLVLRDSYGPHQMYANEGYDTGYAPEIPQRIDAIRNHVATHAGMTVAEAAARTNYFRETYVYGNEIALPGIETFFYSEALVAAAREVHGRPIIVPAIVFANIYLPGQQLAIHTDVGEFLGANRKVVPQWLIIAMHHSGLFEPWKIRIATGISFFGHPGGGALVVYRNGVTSEPIAVAPKHNTAVVIDADSTFHGVARVDGDERATLAGKPGMFAVPGDPWELVADGNTVATMDPNEIRFSVSWKAYCFADEAEERRWRDHTDDLGLDVILDTIEADLRERGTITGERPAPRDFALAMIDEYVKFPECNK